MSLIVEAVGCSGAGKTTVLRDLEARLNCANVPVIGNRSVLARRTGLDRLQSDVAQNIAYSVLLFPWFVRGARVHPAFARFGISRICRNADSTFGLTSRLRAFHRQLAGHVLVREAALRGSVVLVDEGVVSSLHSLLIRTGRPASSEDVERFATLVPTPDLIMHIDTPLKVALARTRCRSTKPLRRAASADIDRFIVHAHQAFQRLRPDIEARCRWLSVPSEDVSSDAGGAVLESVVQCVIRRIKANAKELQ